MSVLALSALTQFAAETGQFGLEFTRVNAIRLHHGADHGVGQQGIQAWFAVAKVHSVVLSLELMRRTESLWKKWQRRPARNAAGLLPRLSIDVDQAARAATTCLAQL
jgi:hypothetical protein